MCDQRNPRLEIASLKKQEALLAGESSSSVPFHDSPASSLLATRFLILIGQHFLKYQTRNLYVFRIRLNSLALPSTYSSSVAQNFLL